MNNVDLLSKDMIIRGLSGKTYNFHHSTLQDFLQNEVPRFEGQVICIFINNSTSHQNVIHTQVLSSEALKRFVFEHHKPNLNSFNITDIIFCIDQISEDHENVICDILLGQDLDTANLTFYTFQKYPKYIDRKLDLLRRNLL